MRRLQTTLLAITCALLPLTHAASDEAAAQLKLIPYYDTEFAVAVNSPLTLATSDEDGLHFSGEIRLSGRYVYGRLGDPEPGTDPQAPTFYFAPDAASQALLPYWKERGPVQGIYLDNSEALRQAVLDPAIAARVDAGTAKSASGPATIWIDTYAATIVCNMPAYTARFLRLEQDAVAVAHNEYADTVACAG